MLIRLLTTCLLLLLVCRANASPVLQIDEPVWDVGTVVDGQGKEKSVTVVNAGDEPLLIEKVEECCGFYGRLEGGPTLLPGETAKLHLTVKPFKMVGDLRAEMFLVSNDPKTPRYSVFAVGQVLPKRHALGELQSDSLDLGIVDRRDRVSFRVVVRSSGNEPLQILKVEKPSTVVETGGKHEAAVGGETELLFDYIPAAPGPIEEHLVIVTNDALNRSLSFRLKGYVTAGELPDRTLAIYPVGKSVTYDVMTRSIHYDFSLANNSQQPVEILRLESSLPLAEKQLARRVEAGQTAAGSVTLRPKPGQVPGKGYLYLYLAIPIEVR